MVTQRLKFLNSRTYGAWFAVALPYMNTVVPSNEIELTPIAFFSVNTYFSIYLQPVFTNIFKYLCSVTAKCS